MLNPLKMCLCHRHHNSHKWVKVSHVRSQVSLCAQELQFRLLVLSLNATKEKSDPSKIPCRHVTTSNNFGPFVCTQKPHLTVIYSHHGTFTLLTIKSGHFTPKPWGVPFVHQCLAQANLARLPTIRAGASIYRAGHESNSRPSTWAPIGS